MILRFKLLMMCLFAACPLFAQNESFQWQTKHPEWIFCDDFEDAGALVKTGRYFEINNNAQGFNAVASVGLNGTRGMRAKFATGEVDPGNLSLSFGRNPNAYMNKQKIHETVDYKEIYVRMYLKMQTGWQGSIAKLMRATVFSSATDWSQAMIAHLWSDDALHLAIDPAGCVDASGKVACVDWNDAAHLKWLGLKSGTTPIFATTNSGIWFCVEFHVKLNDAGKSNGIEEFWINGNLETRAVNLDFVGTYAAYALNAVFFENYWNAGSPRAQERYFDNIVVSTKPIGAYVPSTATLCRTEHNKESNLHKNNLSYYSLLGKLLPATKTKHNGIAIAVKHNNLSQGFIWYE